MQVRQINLVEYDVVEFYDTQGRQTLFSQGANKRRIGYIIMTDHSPVVNHR